MYKKDYIQILIDSQSDENKHFKKDQDQYLPSNFVIDKKLTYNVSLFFKE